MAAEKFEMLKNAHGEKCLSEQGCLKGIKCSKVPQKMRIQQSQLKIMLTAFFDAKVVIHHE
jgi:hypothetical protein